MKRVNPRPDPQPDENDDEKATGETEGGDRDAVFDQRVKKEVAKEVAALVRFLKIGVAELRTVLGALNDNSPDRQRAAETITRIAVVMDLIADPEGTRADFKHFRAADSVSTRPAREFAAG